MIRSKEIIETLDSLSFMVWTLEEIRADNGLMRDLFVDVSLNNDIDTSNERKIMEAIVDLHNKEREDGYLTLVIKINALNNGKADYSIIGIEF